MVAPILRKYRQSSGKVRIPGFAIDRTYIFGDNPPIESIIALAGSSELKPSLTQCQTPKQLVVIVTTRKVAFAVCGADSVAPAIARARNASIKQPAKSNSRSAACPTILEDGTQTLEISHHPPPANSLARSIQPVLAPIVISRRR